MRPIKPKPTTFDGIRYRSRTEARWACLLRHLRVETAYEPYTFTNGSGWDYTPDFWLPNQHQPVGLIQSPRLDLSNPIDYQNGIYLEVKPSDPSDDYLEFLASFQLDLPLWIGICDFYRSPPRLLRVDPLDTSRVYAEPMTELFPDYTWKHYSLVTKWRFDLR